MSHSQPRALSPFLSWGARRNSGPGWEETAKARGAAVRFGIPRGKRASSGGRRPRLPSARGLRGGGEERETGRQAPTYPPPCPRPAQLEGHAREEATLPKLPAPLARPTGAKSCCRARRRTSAPSARGPQEPPLPAEGNLSARRLDRPHGTRARAR